MQTGRPNIDPPHAHLISGLRQFIQGNKRIPAFFAVVEKNFAFHSIMLEQLIAAIQNGDMNHEIFSNPLCMPYLLYIMERMPHRLPFASCVTAYHYLVALAQFTEKQKLKADDMQSRIPKPNVKFLRNIEMVSLVSEDQKSLSEAGSQYFSYVRFRFRMINIELSEVDFLNYLLSLPKIEQRILRIENYEANTTITEVDNFLTRIRDSVPFFRDINQNFFNLPSASLINYFLSRVSGRPVQMKPMFGIINPDTLHQLHLLGEHPVAWYSLLVRDTVIAVHNYFCGPLVAIAHDIGHCFWGTFLGAENRDLINHELIPALKAWGKMRDFMTAKKLTDGLCTELSDYDLTPIISYRDPKTRLFLYVAECLRKVNNVLLDEDKPHFALVIAELRELAIKNMVKEGAPLFWSQLFEHINEKYAYLYKVEGKEEVEAAALERASTLVFSLFSSSSGSDEGGEADRKKWKPA